MPKRNRRLPVHQPKTPSAPHQRSTNAAAAVAARFPDLAVQGDEALAEFLASGRLVELRAGDPVFRAGDACRAWLLVLDGRVPVRLVSEGGREITLYEVESGEACVLTTACLLGEQPYAADARAATPLRAVAFDRDAFARALERSASFRRFVFGQFAQRLGALIARVDDVAFGDIDRRIARALLAGSKDGDVARTHAALATEAGTAREVVSRHLKRYEARGWVALARGRVRIVETASLERLARLGFPQSAR